MRTFLIIWLGQLVSTFGSRMTSFALQIWVWQLTGQATSIALVGFTALLPSILIAPISGIIIDRWNRKYLMMVGDAIAALSTFLILILYLNHHLEIWHLYIVSTLNSAFGTIQELAYTASMTFLVPANQYTRASSLNASIHYGAIIIAPALAGFLYPFISLPGIACIDLSTFVIALSSIWFMTIPQPSTSDTQTSEKLSLRQQLSIGWNYIWHHPTLKIITVLSACFWFFHDIGAAIFSPMLLARTGGNAQILGNISSAAGLGGVTSALLLSWWGGPKQKITGFLNGMIGAGISKIIFGFGQVPQVWIPAQFCSSLNFPLLSSSEQAIWLTQVKPELQGRVLATNSMILQLVSAIAYLVAGPLADNIFEPALRSKTLFAELFDSIWGRENGAGMSMLYALVSCCLCLVGVTGKFLVWYSYRPRE